MSDYPPPAPKTETKVKAATAGAGAGAILGELVNWILDDYIITPDVTGDLPTQVSAAVLIAAAAVVAFISGRVAKHTARPDLPSSQR